MKVINRFTLKNANFMLNMKDTVGFFDILLFPNGNTPLKNQIFKLSKKFLFKENLNALSYLYKMFGKKCLESGKFWLTVEKNCKTATLKWWRILNTREAELEFYEQNFILIFSSSKFKNNKYLK